VHDHVIQALADRGMKVEAALPRVDTAEQYRDMGAVMELAAYVHDTSSNCLRITPSPLS